MLTSMQKLISFAFLLIASSLCHAQTVSEYKLGPWNLGMTRAQIIAQSEYGPYVPVKATGGLETFDATLDGKKENVSFVFDGDKVKFIQVFKYEGTDFSGAREAALNVFRLFDSQFGGTTVNGVSVDGHGRLDMSSFTAFIDRTLGKSIELGEKEKKEHSIAMLITFDMKPVTQPKNCRLHSQLIYDSRTKTFYVFLFQDELGASDRTRTSLIEITPL